MPTQACWPAAQRALMRLAHAGKEPPADAGKGEPKPEGKGEEEDDDACGFCRYMKGGGCKSEFVVSARLHVLVWGTPALCPPRSCV